MSWQAPEGMDEYVKPTELCDCDNIELQGKAKEIIKDAETPRDAALKVFSFVRDGIPWSLDHCDRKASATLKKGWEDCVNKTNLQVALLRAVGIPARCHCVHMPKELIKESTPKFMYNRMPKLLLHPRCECYLSEKWVACEALLDEALYKATIEMGFFAKEQIPTIDWDGEGNLILFKPWIVEDVGIFSSWDDAREATKEAAMPLTMRLFGWFFMSRSNRHTDALRKGK